MILISILWYEGLQIKLACYKILNIKHGIHLDVFAQTGNGTPRSTAASREGHVSKAKTTTSCKTWTLPFFSWTVYSGYFHTLLQRLSFKVKINIYIYFKWLWLRYSNTAFVYTENNIIPFYLLGSTMDNTHFTTINNWSHHQSLKWKSNYYI